MGIKCRINRDEAGRVLSVTTESGGVSPLFNSLAKMFGKEKAADFMALTNSSVLKTIKAMKDSKINAKNREVLANNARFSKSLTQEFRPADQEVIDRLRQSGLAESVFQMSTEEINSKLEELGVDEETRKSIRRVDRRNKIVRSSLALEAYTPQDEIAQYFVSGGRVSVKTIDTLYGNSKGERDARRTIIDKSAPSVSNIAQSLWEDSVMRDNNGESLSDTQDYENAIDEYLSMYTNRLDMAKDLLSRYNQEQLEPDFDYYELPDEFVEEEMIKRGLMQKGITQIVNGFVLNNEVYLNKDVITNETPIHEFSHLYNSWLKSSKPELYKKGLTLVTNELNKKNSDIKDIIDYVKKTQPTLGGEALLEEILAELTGRRGLELINSNKKGGIVDWLRDVWNEIANMLGLSQYTAEQVSGMTLGQFSDAIAVDLLSGKRILNKTNVVSNLRFSVLSEYRDNTKFKYSDLIYPDVVFKDITTESEAKVGEAFYKKIISKFNKTFNRDLKITSKTSDKDFNVVVEYETGLKPKYFAYPTAIMGEHETVDDIDKNVPLTSLRHELIHEMLVKNITDKFERINNLDNSANIVSIEEVQRNRAYNYTIEDVFFERVVENVERNPDNKDTFEVSTFGEDVTNRLKKELEGQDLTKENIVQKLKELLEGSNPWLTETLMDIFENRVNYDFNDLSEINGSIGEIFKQRFTLSKDIFSKELQSKIFDFTEFFNQEYTGVLTRLNKISDRNNLKRVVPGNTLFSTPLAEASIIAEDYMEKNGIVNQNIGRITKLDVENSKEIAEEFDKLVPTPFEKDTRDSYQAMINETIEQYKEITSNGYNVEINNNEPYGSSGEMIEDLRTSKRMKIFSTESGFGDVVISDTQRAENPLLQETEFKDVNGLPLLANDIFRFVHDFFGHAKFGNGFGAIGEENAWNVHVKMYSPLAARAMTTETRGQNSWVNFSGVNEAAFVKRDQARELRKQGKIEEAQQLTQEVYEMMSFAEQKVGLLSPWVSVGNRKDAQEEPAITAQAQEIQEVQEVPEELSVGEVLSYATSNNYNLSEAEHVDLQNTAHSMGLGSYAELLVKLKKGLIKNGIVTFTEKKLLASRMYNKYEVNSIMNDLSVQEAIKRTYQGLVNSENYTFESVNPLYVVKTASINSLGKQEIMNPFKVEQEVRTIIAGKDLSVDLDLIPYDSIKNAYSTNNVFKEELDNISKENRNVPVKKFDGEGLQDKTENTKEELFAATIDFIFVNALNPIMDNISMISPTVWEQSKTNSVYALVKDFNNRASKAGVDFMDLEDTILYKSQDDVVGLIEAFSDLMNGPTDPNMEYFSSIYSEFFNISEQPQTKTVKTQNDDSVFLDTDISEISLFNESGLIKESQNIYRQVEVIEDLQEAYEVVLQNKSKLPSTVTTLEDLKQYVNQIINGYNLDSFEVDLNELENLILHKIYFDSPMSVSPSKDMFAAIRFSTFKGDSNYFKSQFVSDFYKEYLAAKRIGSQSFKDFYSNFQFDNKGITLRDTDPITMSKMEPYIDETLLEYNLVSKHLNMPIEVSEMPTDINDMQFNREYAISNPTSVEKIKGDYATLSPETIAVKNEVRNFVRTPSGIFEYDFQTGDIAFYNKLSEGSENYNSYGEYKVKPSSSIDARDYGNLETTPTEFIKAKKYYSKSELAQIDKNNFSC